MNVSITSLNLQGFENWDTRVSPIIAYLRGKSPHLICFQEVVYLPEVSPNSPVALLNEGLGYPYESTDITRLQVGIEYPVYREGLGTLTYLPIVKSESLILELAVGDRHNRIVQLLDVKVNESTTLKIANVHFSITDTSDFATPHLLETLAFLKARGEKRIIIGDFNLRSLDHVREHWSTDYTSTADLYNYVSFPELNKCIDYALVPKEFTIDTFEISPDGLSDHRAITMSISVPDATI